MDKNILIRDHLERWAKVKRKWIEAASENESRYSSSIQILNAIYNRYVNDHFNLKKNHNLLENYLKIKIQLYNYLLRQIFC